MKNMTKALTAIAEIMKAKRDGFVYGSIEELVLKTGRDFMPRRMTKKDAESVPEHGTKAMLQERHHARHARPELGLYRGIHLPPRPAIGNRACLVRR